MLYQILKSVAGQHPGNLALADDKRSADYQHLWNASVLIAERLHAEGVRQGDRVCLLSENCIDSVALYWAILQCEGIAVYLNEQTPAEGIEQIVDDAEPSVIVATEKLAKSKLSDSVKSRSSIKHLDLRTLCSIEPDQISGAAVNVSKALSDARNADPDAIATIVYTSGSTGKPKGVCLTHTNLISVAKMAGDAYNTVPTDSYLMVVPLHYIHGLMILVTMHLRGAGIHFMNSFMFPKLVTKKLIDTGVSGFSGVPFHITALIERGGFLDAALPNLRWVGVTGGTCATERLAQIRKRLPDIEIHISYGQTEASPRITALHPDKIDTKADSVGNVAEGLHVEFLDEAGNPVPQGEAGELVVAGPTIMHGYWNDPENTARAVDEQRRLHTGDIAYIDEEGDVFIRGRIQAMIKSAGERIFPEELEAVLSLSPDVVDVAVVGIPDPLYGQRVEAHVILSDENPDTLESVRKHCLDHVAFARSPKHYHRWSVFPLKANGKTDKQQLISAADNAPGRVS
ncbi:MAG: class I adenylate-forming enzyme family protein [Granulosicoccaceae bacterium]